IQPDGKIVVVGSSYYIGTYSISLCSDVIVLKLIGQEYLLVPSSQQGFSYPSTDAPKKAVDPTLARPIGVGPVATGGDTLSIHINISQFSETVDVYFGIFAPSIEPDNVYLLTSDYSFQPVSIGLNQWKINTPGPIDEYLFGDIPISELPSGIYYIYLAVTPTGSLDNFYIWTTYFEVP
ncbi:MAG: hypothetical protein L6N96_03225, partial [Candidatus Methylarchaceae archaeon HK02M2]|nr:hypothetical protein [Candidatus Methylarchaceae archaeon HK02M2]